MKQFLGVIVGLVVIGGIAGGYFYPHFSVSVGTTSGTAATQHIAEFAFNPTTASATTTSVVNGDAQDRVVRAVDIACSGVGTSRTAYTGGGLAALTFTAATTSTSAPAALGNTNYTFQGNISTSTADVYAATSTVNGVNSATGNSMRWPAGAYMTISSNATNTMACVVSVSYLLGLGI